MKTPLSKDVLDQYSNMGFSEALIRMAWEAIDSEAQLLDKIVSLTDENAYRQPSSNKQSEEVMIEKAIMESFQTNPQHGLPTFEVTSPEQRKRMNGIPCGLKNVGNTCYFNCLLQTYFFNPEFVKFVLQWKETDNPQQKAYSVTLAKNLQQLFILLIGSDKKYVDPSEVIKSICDDFGNVLPIGDQKDVGEFNNYFLSSVSEGLSTQIQKHQESNIHEPHENGDLSTSSILLRMKSSQIHDENPISRMFFCKTKHILQFNQSGVPQKRENTDLYNFIPLALELGNLYDSFDGFVVNEVDDFKNDLAELVNATKYNWIQEAPQTLSFQIQRVAYSKEKNELIKLNDEFHFDEEIYLDRFLDSNSVEYLKIRNKNKEFKEKQKKLRLDLQRLSKFNDQYDLQDVLKTAIKFLEIQNSNDNDNPACFGKQDQKNTIECLQKYALQVQKRKEVYQQQLIDLENKIQASYNDLKKHKYILQSILIHEGQANSGHYYAYIKDFYLKKWFKFNDTQVIEETEAKVFQDAIGLKQGVNAYLLIYVRAEEKQQQQQQSLRSYYISSEKEYLQDEYGRNLTDKQKEQLIKENKLFATEIEDYKNARSIERIIEQYQIRFEFINENFRNITNKYKEIKFKPLITLNLPIFIKNKSTLLNPQNTQHDNIIKWSILDSSIKEITQKNVNEITEDFKRKILQKLESQFNEFKRPKATLLPSEITDYTKFLNEYNQYIQLAAQASLLQDQFLKRNWISTLQLLQNLIKQVKFIDQQHYVYRFVQNMKKLVPITIICSMLKNDVQIETLHLLQTFLSMKHLAHDDKPIWEPQLSIMFNLVAEVHHLDEIQQIIVSFENDTKIPKYVEQLEQLTEEIKNEQGVICAQYDSQIWSPYNQQDILFEKLMTGWDQLKVQYDPFIKLQQEIQKSQLPLMKEDLQRVLK